MIEAVWSEGTVPPLLLELCRLRISTLCGDREGMAERRPEAAAAELDEDLIGALAHWSTDPRFGPSERVVIGLAEQFVIDVHSITDEQVDELKASVGDAAALALLFAFAAFDGFARLRSLLLDPA
jgi:alkylhydroperoxidase family enzyme